MLHRIQARFMPWRFGVAILCTLGMLSLTHIPPRLIPGAFLFHVSDKVQHATMYALITMFFTFALRRPRRMGALLFISSALLLVGVADELTQPLVNRDADILDFLADLLGVLAALLICLLWDAVRSRMRTPVSSSVEAA